MGTTLAATIATETAGFSADVGLILGAIAVIYVVARVSRVLLGFVKR